MRTIRRRWCTALGSVLLLAATGCGGYGTTEPPLRVALSVWPGYEVLPIAEEEGFFTAEGVPVRLLELSTLSDVRRVFERGQADAMACTLVELLEARDQSAHDPRVVAVLDVSTGGDVVVGSPRVASLAALRGRRVGLEAGTVSGVLLVRALESVHLGLRDVQLVYLDQNQLAEALDAGEVDAAVTYSPWADALLAQPGAHRLFDSGQIPDEILDVLAVDAPVLAARPEAVAALVRAVGRARDVMVGDPMAAATRIAEREGLPPSNLQRLLTSGMRFPTRAEQRAMLSPGGILERASARVDAVLRAEGRLEQPPRLAALTGPVAADTEGRP